MIDRYNDVIAGRRNPAMSRFHPSSPAPQRPGLGERAGIAVDLTASCRLCFRRCGVDRRNGEEGYCRLDNNLRVVLSETLHGEEPRVNPTYEVFLAGCNLRCSFCYMKRWIDCPQEQPPADINNLIRLIQDNIPSKSVNLHWVGGEPSVSLPAILTVLDRLSKPVPMVWNSNMTMSDEALELLDGLADLVLADIHFGNEQCARRLGADPAHLAQAMSNIRIMATRTDMILRHLYLPGHFDCCFIPIMEWIQDNIPHVPVHIMSQFIPPPGKDPVLSYKDRRSHLEEIERAREYALTRGLISIDSTPELTRATVSSSGFETEILIDPDGSVAFRNLSGEFFDLIKDMRLDRRMD